MDRSKFIALVAIVACVVTVAISAYAQNVLNYASQGGDTWTVGGTLNVTGTFNKDSIEQPTVRTGTGAIDNGADDDSVSISGITGSSVCHVQALEDPTNNVYLLFTSATTDLLYVSASGDPGASGLDFSALCLD